MTHDPTGARSFAAALHTLADIAECNADAATDQALSDAFTNAATALMDAACGLRVAADNVDGVWEKLPDVMELPLERM